MSIVIYQIDAHTRSRVICGALEKGFRAINEDYRLRWEHEYSEPEADVAVFYGLEGKLQKIFDEYRAAGRAAVYVDLGYWGRREGGRWTGFHKLVVNARHPTRYFQARAHCSSRARALGIVAKPWRTDGLFILLAGMGDKGANAEGYDPEQWERITLAEIRRHTKRPIVYRPKPSWKEARPIEGLGYSSKKQPLEEILPNCFCVVTHHSNVAVDGLVDGIPAFVWGGVALPLGLQDLAQIESPLRPAGREQWINDIAWTQFSVAEIGAGVAWRHLKDEGLVP